MKSQEFEVVIVGAGPGGLAAAVTLGEHGVRTLLIERRTSPSTLPRANTASTGTMELLRRWGLERGARERSLDVEFRAWAAADLTTTEGEAIDVGFPTREQAPLISPTAPAAIGQDELEPLLEGRARSLASVHIARGVELLGLQSAAGGHTLAVRGPDERDLRVEARYVIGADGMHSTVRRELGIPTTGASDLGRRLAIHFRAPLWGVLGNRRHVIYFLTAEPEDRVFIPIGKPNRWVFAMHWDDSVPVEQLDERRLAGWIVRASGAPGLELTIDRVLRLTYGTDLADRFRQGDAFLIGDAAHRVTPRGATGLNTAIRDGFDLGWKLAWVLRRWAGDGLLDSYERERRPVAEFNTRRSSLSDGSVLGNHFGLSADIGGRIPHVWVERDGRFVSTLDLLGPGFTLFAGPDWSGAVDAGTPPVTVERLDAITARGLGLASAGCMLARPDGQPVSLSNPLSGDDYSADPIGGPSRVTGGISCSAHSGGSTPSLRAARRANSRSKPAGVHTSR
jgi:2-polyprenyl-6-methoxyphenol hydroxylase-like FAD-dependent oxidoreductase